MQITHKMVPWMPPKMVRDISKMHPYTNFGISLNIFYFQQITSYTVQYIQFIRKLGLEQKRKLIEFFSYYRVHCDMEGGLYHINL